MQTTDVEQHYKQWLLLNTHRFTVTI